MHYDQECSSDVSVYKIYETYLNLIPRTGNFYRKPLNGVKFSAGNIPQRELKTMMKSLFQKADISLDRSVISNHSGRVTLCTLFNDRYNDKTVMNWSKHTSTAVHSYQREQFPLQSKVCAEFEPAIRQEIMADYPDGKNRNKHSSTNTKALAQGTERPKMTIVNLQTK